MRTRKASLERALIALIILVSCMVIMSETARGRAVSQLILASEQ
jgi:hypothetical protein